MGQSSRSQKERRKDYTAIRPIQGGIVLLSSLSTSIGTDDVGEKGGKGQLHFFIPSTSDFKDRKEKRENLGLGRKEKGMNSRHGTPCEGKGERKEKKPESRKREDLPKKRKRKRCTLTKGPKGGGRTSAGLFPLHFRLLPRKGKKGKEGKEMFGLPKYSINPREGREGEKRRRQG